jgi:hypothetical protein
MITTLRIGKVPIILEETPLKDVEKNLGGAIGSVVMLVKLFSGSAFTDQTRTDVGRYGLKAVKWAAAPPMALLCSEYPARRPLIGDAGRRKLR